MSSLNHLIVLFQQLDVFVFPDIALAECLFERYDFAICFFGIFDDIFWHFGEFLREVVTNGFTISNENMKFKFRILNVLVVARPAIACFCGYLFFIESRRFYRSCQDLAPVKFGFLIFQRG